MELISQVEKRTDNGLLAVTHLCQLISYVFGFGGLIVPLVLWLIQKDKIEGMDEHGKSILNFQLSLILYIIIGIPAIFILGLGILFLVATAIIGFVLPIVNAIRAANGEAPSYFMTIRFVK